jgi:D-alanine-D-alanine ligase
MTLKVAIIYNDPFADVPNQSGEEEAIVGVLEEVFAVRDALKELKLEWQQVPLRPPLDSAGDAIHAIEADLIFNLFEGFDDSPHSEPLIARMMEDMGRRFTGNPSRVLDLTLDKARTKELLKSKGIGTPDYQVLTPQTVTGFKLVFPCIVKPRDEDASHGLLPENVVHTMEQLEKQVQRISGEFRGYALVEEFVDGREFNASVLGKKDLEMVEMSEITYTLPPELPRILTFESKWFEGTPYYLGTGVQCPAQVGPDLRKTIEDVVLRSCLSVGISGYARVDMRQDDGGNIKVLEVNANPDLSPELGIALQAEKRGLSYSQLIRKIIDIALE